MIDRRQLVVGAGVSLVVMHVPAWRAGTAQPELIAAHWAPTRHFAVGDQLGYVCESIMRARILLYTVVVTSVREERGGWNFSMESLGQPATLYPEGEPYDSYDRDATKRLWHLLKFGPARPQ